MTKISYNLYKENENYNFNSKAVEGIVEKSKLSEVFFGKSNIELLQKLIASEIYEKTGEKIHKQSENELLIIMRSYFLQEGNNVLTNDEDIKNEIRKLDIIVKNDSVKRIIVMLKQHKAHIKAINNVVTPLERAESTNVKGTKLREMHRFV